MEHHSDVEMSVPSSTRAEPSARVGDVSTTLEPTHADVLLGHIEAGLRSFERRVHAEDHRIVTDQFSDLLFIHSDEAQDNLVADGRKTTFTRIRARSCWPQAPREASRRAWAPARV